MEALRSADESPPLVHVAIIMDGNGRWAKARGLPRTMGHKRGAEAVREVVNGSAELGIRYLTLFGFSSENWSRPEDEVRDLMGLLRLYLKSEIKTLHKNGIRLRVIGERWRFKPDLIALIESGEELTKNNDRLILTLALSYGGRQELTNAMKEIAAKVASGDLSPEAIDEECIADHLLTRDMPDPDVIIRTSGEMRISNFLLWQSAYTELVFVDTLWPDFTRSDLEVAISAFRRRNRRYGASV